MDISQNDSLQATSTSVIKRVKCKDNKAKKKETYAVYIYKLLKQVHPNMLISKKSMVIMDGFVNCIFERIARESSLLSRSNGRSAISSCEIQASVQKILPAELAKNAITEGTKAIISLPEVDSKKKAPKKKSYFTLPF
jgi:histone H2B